MEATEPRAARDHSPVLQGLALVGVLAAAMWIVEAIDQVAGGSLDRNGIQPRDADGLDGVLWAPFLHDGFQHLIGNTVPFLLLGVGIALGGIARVAAVTVIVALVGGLGTWLVAPENTNHIGASGLVFGYAAYLVARGAFTRSLAQIAMGLVVVASGARRCCAGWCPRTGSRGRGTCSARSAASSPPGCCTAAGGARRSPRPWARFAPWSPDRRHPRRRRPLGLRRRGGDPGAAAPVRPGGLGQERAHARRAAPAPDRPRDRRHRRRARRGRAARS